MVAVWVNVTTVWLLLSGAVMPAVVKAAFAVPLVLLKRLASVPPFRLKLVVVAVTAGVVLAIFVKEMIPVSVSVAEPAVKLPRTYPAVSAVPDVAPMANAVGRVSEGATLLPTAPTNRGATELSVVGLGGDFLG